MKIPYEMKKEVLERKVIEFDDYFNESKLNSGIFLSQNLEQKKTVELIGKYKDYNIRILKTNKRQYQVFIKNEKDGKDLSFEMENHIYEVFEEINKRLIPNYLTCQKLNEYFKYNKKYTTKIDLSKVKDLNNLIKKDKIQNKKLKVYMNKKELDIDYELEEFEFNKEEVKDLIYYKDEFILEIKEEYEFFLEKYREIIEKSKQIIFLVDNEEDRKLCKIVKDFYNEYERKYIDSYIDKIEDPIILEKIKNHKIIFIIKDISQIKEEYFTDKGKELLINFTNQKYSGNLLEIKISSKLNPNIILEILKLK